MMPRDPEAAEPQRGDDWPSSLPGRGLHLNSLELRAGKTRPCRARRRQINTAGAKTERYRTTRQTTASETASMGGIKEANIIISKYQKCTG